MKQVFQPDDLRRFRRQMYMVYTPFLLFFLYEADGWPSRLIFLVFATVFLLIVHGLMARAVAAGRPIVLDEHGLHHESLLERYGIRSLPWAEIASIKLVRGSKRSEWLSFTLLAGPFRAGLKRHRLERLMGGDVNLALSHDKPGTAIVAEVLSFWQRYRRRNRPAADG